MSYSCYFSPPEIVSLLLEQGADVNSVDPDGNAPLTRIKGNAEKIDRLLIKKLAILNFEHKPINDKNFEFILKK